MQNILSLNIYNSGITALIIEGGVSSANTIIEKQEVNFADNSFYHNLIKLIKENDSSELKLVEEDNEDEVNKAEEELSKAKATLVLEIENLKNNLINPFTEVIAVIPAVDNLSCRIELPFNDSKTIKQVINMEVQDTLAFDVNDFVVPYKFIEEKEANKNEFFISLIPKNVIAFLIEAFKEAEIEPYVITTPASVLSSVYNLEALDLDLNSVCLIITDKSVEISIIQDGTCVFSRSIDFNYLDNEVSTEHLLSQLKLTLNSQEKERDITFEKIYLLHSSINKSEVQHFIGRSVEDLSIGSMLKDGSEDSGNYNLKQVVCYLAGLTMKPSVANNGMSNFRVREFSFNPYISLLVTSLKKVLPFLYLFLILLFLYVTSIFLSREYKIIRLRKAVSQNSIEYSGVENLSKGKEVSQIYGKSISLENQLESLGRRSQLSALDVMFNLTKDIDKAKKASPELDIKEIKINGDNLIISGKASAYSDVEKFEILLKKRSETYCKIRRDTSNSNSRARGFKFIISLCES